VFLQFEALKAENSLSLEELDLVLNLFKITSGLKGKRSVASKVSRIVVSLKKT
jgi:hypothetical protein